MREPELAGPTDPHEIARAVAADLREPNEPVQDAERFVTAVETWISAL